LLDRLDGHPKAAAFHDGKRFTATTAEFAAAQVAFDDVLTRQAERQGETYDPDALSPDDAPQLVVDESISLRDRLRL
jgi:hypothetical protein